MKIGRQLAEDLLYADEGRVFVVRTPDGEVGPWRKVGDEERSSGRWTEHRWCIVALDPAGDLWAFAYQVGLTEVQEMDPLDDAVEVELFRVRAREVTSVTYERIRQ